MKLIFIGTGSAFTVGNDNYNSNMLLVDKNTEKKLLIDCGSDARHALNDIGYSHTDISDVYISHLHADHSGGLEWLALSNKLDPKSKVPNLYASNHVLQKIWDHTLSGGLSTLQDESASLDTFFKVHPINDDQTFNWNQINFQLVETIHVVSDYSFMPSFGLIFSINDKKIFITTDTQFAPEHLMSFYHDADLIFHDCETAENKSGVHAHFDELSTLPDNIKSKMWLYHFNPGKLPDANEAGFLGFIRRGQEFDLDSI